ncbi:MAG: folylpolyglutamate synthase/dihydrofolate synthase family protein, partial [Vicinamibacterales bacterium]
FQRAGVETAVLEVGLGGRLDATNVVRPAVCAITSIALDHERLLGATIAAIAAEKAGILKPDIPVVVGRMPAAASAVIHETALAVGAPLLDAVADVEVVQVGRSAGWDTARVTMRTPVRDYGEVALALRGRHQFDNAAVAVRVLETLDASGVRVSGDAIARGLSSARWPGRLELRRVSGGREILFDAAHNPSGASTLARYLQDAATGRLPIVFGAAGDKDIEGMLKELRPAASLFVATRSSNARAEEPATISAIAQRVAPEVPVAVEVDPLRALDVAWARSPSIVVAGSIFLLGDVMSSLGGS